MRLEGPMEFKSKAWEYAFCTFGRKIWEGTLKFEPIEDPVQIDLKWMRVEFAGKWFMASYPSDGSIVTGLCAAKDEIKRHMRGC